MTPVTPVDAVTDAVLACRRTTHAARYLSSGGQDLGDGGSWQLQQQMEEHGGVAED